MLVTTLKDNRVQVTFPIEAGRFARRGVRRILRTEAVCYGLGCEVDEDKGFLGSTLYFTLTGDRKKVNNFLRAVIEWIEDMGGEVDEECAS